MSENPVTPSASEQEIQDAIKRVKKIKKFYKELYSWIGTSIFLIAINLFFSGEISWSRYPVFFWGIALVIQFFQVLHLQRMDKEWEEKMIRKFTRQAPRDAELPQKSTTDQVDYSDELLNNEPLREKEIADLSEYRKLKRPWKEEDLV